VVISREFAGLLASSSVDLQVFLSVCRDYPNLRAEAERLSKYGYIEEVVAAHELEEHAVITHPCVTGTTRAILPPLRIRQRAFVRYENEHWILLHPDLLARVKLSLGSLALAIERSKCANSVTTLAEALCSNGFLVGEAEYNKSANDSGWEFHDQFFHSATVHGTGTTGRYGATYPGRMTETALPPWSHYVSSQRGEFLAPLTTYDTSELYRILTRRRTVRRFKPRAVEIETLKSLCNLALRTLSIEKRSSDYEAFYPYASGGARDEIVTIIASRDGPELCSLFIYVNHRDRLFRVSNTTTEPDHVLSHLNSIVQGEASTAAAPVALLFALDHSRMSMKYEAVAYATALRNVGGIYQTISLAAEVAGLGVCAIGGGWGFLEKNVLKSMLGSHVLIGAMLLGYPDIDRSGATNVAQK
jgi:SagB-type dehydrogenase family enzyme